MILRYLDFIVERFKKPDKTTEERISSLVANLEKKYIGGRLFFNALDNEIKNTFNQDIILQLVSGCNNDWVVCSGEFGNIVFDLWKSGKFKSKGVLVFNGKMTTKKIGINWYYPDINLENKEFIYVDDSYFSGSTYKKIENFLTKYNSKIKSIYVIYDGSKEKNKNVKSFFRYYK